MTGIRGIEAGIYEVVIDDEVITTAFGNYFSASEELEHWLKEKAKNSAAWVFRHLSGDEYWEAAATHNPLNICDAADEYGLEARG